jgi:hypothetical protein
MGLTCLLRCSPTVPQELGSQRSWKRQTRAVSSYSSADARPIIIGEVGDEHVQAVANAVEAKGGNTPLVLNAEILERTDYLLDTEGIRLGGDRDRASIRANVGTRGWIRRLAPEGWREDASPASHDGVVRIAWYVLLSTLIRGYGVEWLTSLDRLVEAENKALQNLTASRLGVCTPRTVVTSRSDWIPASLDDALILKPLGPGSFSDAGRLQVVFANVIARQDPVLESLAGAPFLVQERLEAEAHLRVVTVNDRAWVCALDATRFPVDWRRADEAHGSFQSSNEFDPVAADALRVSGALGIQYSSQDWIVARNEAYLLDVNPGGQWLFLPDDVADDVTSAIAQWLAYR